MTKEEWIYAQCKHYHVTGPADATFHIKEKWLEFEKEYAAKTPEEKEKIMQAV